MEMTIIFSMAFLSSFLFWKLYGRPLDVVKFLFVSLAISGFGVMIYTVSLHVLMNAKTGDVEIWNGRVTDKQQETRNCQRGWRDNRDSFCTEYVTREVLDYCEIVTDSNGNSSQRCHYKTQYRYLFERESKWFVDTTLGRYEISRVNRDGSKMPHRYNIVDIGEHVSKENRYTNYLLIENNAFYWLGEPDLYEHPAYPRVTDYYRSNTLINVSNVETPENWNEQLNRFRTFIAPELQLNVVVVLTSEPRPYWESLMAAWQGGKKNDVIMVFGLNDSGEIDWFNSNSFARGFGNTSLHANLRMLASTNDMNLNSYLDVISKQFVRYEMANMDYLKSQVKLSNLAIFWIIMVNIGLSAIVWVIIQNNNTKPFNRYKRNSYQRRNFYTNHRKF